MLKISRKLLDGTGFALELTMPLLAMVLTLLVGLSLGLFGGGGSILTVPILLYVLAVPAKQAIVMSLFIVSGASLVAMLGHARAGRVAWRMAAWFALASMPASYLAGLAAQHMAGSWQLAGFSAVMLLTGGAMLRPRCERVDATPSPLKALAAGTAVGALTGLLGVGGGFLIVPALAMFTGLTMPCAVGTSLLVIALNAAAGFVAQVGHTQLDFTFLTMLTVLAALGTVLGTALARRLAPAQLRRGFGLFVLATGAVVALEQVGLEALGLAARDARLTHLAAAIVGAVLTLGAVRLRARVEVRSHS
jgi:uncharacterized membrane protein YfcA